VKLLFVNLSPLSFDVATPGREPLGGSESCVCYLARQLAANGHDVTLAARLPAGTPDIVMGVRHRPIAAIQDQAFFAAEEFAAIIICNAPVAAPHLREISPASRIILWCHMLPDQPAMQVLPEVQPALDAIIFVAEGQRKAHGLSGASYVIGNGMAPAFENMFASPKEFLTAKQNRAVYTSTPFRGLRLLLDVVEQRQPGTQFDIFSSMRVYQKADEAEFAALYRRASALPGVICHGAVSQSELAQRLKTAAFLAYPCIFPECYCIAALEAQAAGLQVIASDCGSLAESTMDYADILPLEPEKGETHFVTGFGDLLARNIATFKTAPEAWAEKMFDQVAHVNRHCRWAVRASEWERMLSVLAQ
jgi:glycosyltransferase involved in cell wall biosynthesis